MKDLILTNGIIITPFEKIQNRVLFLKGGKIEKLISAEEFEYYDESYISDYEIIDAGNNFIAPGFIDIHTHGANDADAVKDPIDQMAEFKVKHGTTGFLPTLWTAEFDWMVDACKKINDFMKAQSKGSKVLGINSEGPYLNPELGAQKKELVRTPEYKDYRRLIEASDGNLIVMTVAPELEGALELIKYLRQNNVIVSIGHTDIKIDKMHEALDRGITLVTHLLNAMGDSIQVDAGVKALGIQEELLICDQLMCEVLSDKKGVHVKPTLLKIILRCKGVENIVLITDSMNMTGFPPGTYSLQDGRKAIIKDGEDTVRLENGGLAGSVMTMDRAIGNFINHTGVRLEDAVRMATFNPAKAINFSDRKGEIKEGMDADIAVFDDDIDVKLTIVEGEIRYNKL